MCLEILMLFNGGVGFNAQLIVVIIGFVFLII